MATLRGWAPRGSRLIARVPHGHWKTTTSWPHCATIGSRRHGFSMARSTARASQFTSRRFSSRPCSPVTLSSWTISAATKAKPCGRSSAHGAPSCSFCRNIRPTSTPSSRSSPSSSTCCAKPPREPSRPSGTQSVSCSQPSYQRNAPTISKTLDTPQPKFIPL